MTTLPEKTVLRSLLVLLLAAASGCTTTNINELRHRITGIQSGETVVILGRRHKSDYNTSPDFIECVGDEVAGGDLKVIGERQFLDNFYPWFEPRTAPTHVEAMQRLLENPVIGPRLQDLGIRYMVWIDGITETTSDTGQISCAAGPGGAGCFGFRAWERQAAFDASVWDLKTLVSAGKIRSDASGTSYMPAVIIPLPMIARVENSACEGLGQQLRLFLLGQ